LTGHDKTLALSDSKTFDRKWMKKPDPARKVAPDYLKVMLDEYGLVAVTSGTDKQIMLFDTETGRLLCKANCGEITTGMSFSTNYRHLITTSSLGVIYIWRLPEEVSTLFSK
jgi:WD40 repeat protein